MQDPIRTELHFPINVKYSLQNKVYLSIASIRSEMLHMYGNYVYVSFMGFLLFSYSKSDFTIIIHQKKKNSMAPFIVYLIFMTISQTCVVAMLSKTYEARLGLFNRVSIYEPLEHKHSGSLLGCSVLCGIGCNCFNFNVQTGTCLLYNSCNPLHLTVSESGWCFFTDPSLEPIGEYVLLPYVQKFAKKYILLLNPSALSNDTYSVIL